MRSKTVGSCLENVPLDLPGAVFGDMAMFNRQLVNLMEASQQAFAVFDSDDRLRFANTMFRETMGVAEDTFPNWMDLIRNGYGVSAGPCIETDDFELWLRSAKTRRGKLPYRTFETRLKNGQWILVAETTLPGGWMLCIATDISELSTELRDLRQQRDRALKSALSDDLTGLGNRRYLMDNLRSSLGPAKAQTMALIILDIDHFKLVNDRFGHARGDRVLKHFAERLSAVASRDDLFGRIGGEEFLLVLGGSRMHIAKAVLESLFLSLRNVSALTEIPDFRYTCSAGIAYADPGDSPEEVLRRADKALYEAKRAGRDRFVFHDPDI